MEKEVKFNSESLLNIKFEKDVKGYNPLEVDETLDAVIEDYKIYEKETQISKNELAKQKQEIDNLKNKVNDLEIALTNAKASLKAMPSGANQDNVSLLKRIDALERALYQKGVDPKKI